VVRRHQRDEPFDIPCVDRGVERDRDFDLRSVHERDPRAPSVSWTLDLSSRSTFTQVQSVAETLSELALATGFSGVVRIDLAGEPLFTEAFGFADLRHGILNAVDTRFGVASGTKGLTALAVMSVIESGLLSLGTPARSVLGDDLSLIDDSVSVEHLLAHRSGIGDYLDESELSDVNDYVMAVPVHQLASTADYVQVLGGHPQVSSPGKRFAYNNSGFVILALILDRVTGQRFEDIVHERVCVPAELTSTSFVRSDALAGDMAQGYLGAEGLRTNALHLPLLGSGDGGIFSTAIDTHKLRSALFENRIVSAESVRLMTRPRSDVPDEQMRYGLGLWIHASTSAVMLEGSDAGVSFRTVHDPAAAVTRTVLANTSAGAWPITREIDRLLGM